MVNVGCLYMWFCSPKAMVSPRSAAASEAQVERCFIRRAASLSVRPCA